MAPAKRSIDGREWTRSNTYLRNSLANPWPPMLPPTADSTDAFCEATFVPQFNEDLKREKSGYRWIDRIELTPEEVTTMINDGAECPLCHQFHGRFRYQGIDSGIILQKHFDHGCQVHARTGRHWRKLVPPRFRGVRLDSLEPFPDSMLAIATQQHHIQFLKEHRHNSFLLAGGEGTGKTHFAFALLFEALTNSSLAVENDDKLSPSVFFVDTFDLLEHTQDYKTDKREDAPVVVSAQIDGLIKQGNRVSLFLDEIDKFSPTEPRLNLLLGLVRSVANGRGQIVATSNLLLEELQEKWKGFSAAKPILRRLAGKLEYGLYLEFLTAPEEK
jgi:hypothetical protein